MEVIIRFKIYKKEVGTMLVNMSMLNNRKRNSSISNINGTFASFSGSAASFNGMFAFKISYVSPASVSVLAP
jgi:hypothetical protein